MKNLHAMLTPSFYLLLATVFWSFSFTWTKDAVDAANRGGGVPHDSGFGTALVLGMRFALAGLVWFAIFPNALPWSLGIAGWRRLLVVAVLFSMGLVFQTLCLVQTTEAVSAFLTSLVVLIVPMLMAYGTGLLRRLGCDVQARRIPMLVWVCVGVAVPGFVMMSWAPEVDSSSHQAAASGVHVLGVAYGLLCAAAFSMQIFALNDAVRAHGSFTVTGTLFVLSAVMILPWSMSYGVPPARAAEAVMSWEVAWRVGMLVLLPGVLAFGLANHFQPKVEPYRAAIIYLLEPVLTAVIAFWLAGRGLTGIQMFGAAFILIANVLCELVEAKERDRSRRESSG